MAYDSQTQDDPSLCDQFDRLPDAIVLVIFNSLAEARSLGQCLSVSKRFNALVPLVHDVYIKMDQVVTSDGENDDSLNLSSRKPRNSFTHFVKLMLFALLKPLNHLRNENGANKSLFPQVSSHFSTHVLKKFTHVRNLRIELPAGDVDTEDGVMLKWRAEFGSTLQSCVVLAGTKVEPKFTHFVEDNDSIHDAFYTNGGLKLRVVWTINSLIAASKRHYLVRPIVEDHPTIESLTLTDADGQGTLSMGPEQLREFRENPMITTSAESNRTPVPASNMKLRYASFLELPEGVGMQGATFVAIRPSKESCNMKNCCTAKEAETFICRAFDGPLNSAVKALVKRRTYLLDMNGF